MIVKSSNGKKREFKGIHFDLLATGEKAMVTRMFFNTGEKVLSHSHPNEQCGYVVTGNYELTIGNVTELISPGDSYSVPENIEHAIEVISGGIIIDFFTPLRKDYL